MSQTLNLLTQLANGLAKQFGPSCEIIIHDLKAQDIAHSIVYIVNGQITQRSIGDGPSKVVLETLKKNPVSLKDHLGYLIKTSDGKILKSSTIFIRNADNTKIDYILGINYDISNLLAVDQAVKAIVNIEEENKNQQTGPITHNVNELLTELIDESVALIGKPATLMNKDEKVKAIRFLNDAGAFLITKSGDKISKYFGISKFTLYSYIDLKNNKPQRAK
jgi:predicted transcriptional regulator YheO